EEIAELVQAEDGGMTRREWLACTDPNPMLRFLLGTDSPRVQDVEAFPACKGSHRKLRLFACACYARVRHLLPNPLARTAVEVAERCGDGEVAAEDLRLADVRLRESIDALEGRWRASRGAERTALLPEHDALALAGVVCWSEAPKAAYYASSNAYYAAAAIANPDKPTSDPGFSASRTAEERAQADLLRDLFGPYPLYPTRVDPSWRTETVVVLARAAYQERELPGGRLDPARLAVLADALEDAGATAADLLAHLRGPGPHVRGCFAVDQLLGRK